MRVSRRISRQRNVRFATAAIFIAVGGASAIAWHVFDTWMIGAMGAIAVITGLVIAAIPTDRMHDRWFHLLPPVIALEVSLAAVSLSPNGGAVVGLFAFTGPAIAFVIDKKPWAAAHLLFATAVLLAPLAFVDFSDVTLIGTLLMVPITWGLGAFVMLVWEHAEDQAQQLEQLVRSDPLTGIGNRRLLDERLEYELRRHERGDHELALIVMDLNRFKEVNDTLGHAAGDDVLREAADRLVSAVRAQDTVVRQGGDEFCVLAPECGSRDAAEIVRHIRAELRTIDAAGQPLEVAVGYATYPRDARDAEALTEIADTRQRADKARPAAPEQIPSGPRFGRHAA
ncbi:MAG: GGDEF domain-containing protein [Solirubrobacteraceae bacterium]|nr:GGDEF domain-containing protein [Solirubrobacteraceae bacterium]